MTNKFFLTCLFWLKSKGIIYGQPDYCCSTIRELTFPGSDFEFDPVSQTGGYITHSSGPFGPWTVTRSCVDHTNALLNSLLMTRY